MMNSQLPVYFLLAWSIAFASVDCNSEGDILYAWKTKLVDPHNVLQSWDPNLVNPCTWYHVSCDGDNSVVRLDLGVAGLSGPLIPELANLSNLQYLELYGNHINGTIPTELGKLRRLVSFDLYQNHLSGIIPKSFGHLNSLRFFRVSQNNLSGAIPASLGHLTSLEILHLNGNKFAGSVPISVLSLILRGNLRTLDVSENLLAGTIRRGNSTVSTIIQDPRALKY